MKKIAFLDSKVKKSFDEFEQIQLQLIKAFGEKYNFISKKKIYNTNTFCFGFTFYKRNFSRLAISFNQINFQKKNYYYFFKIKINKY